MTDENQIDQMNEAADEKPSSDTRKNPLFADAAEGLKEAQQNRFFRSTVYILFAWIMVGISLLYGVRFYFNDPMHPTFLPLVGAAFAASLSFVIVISLDYLLGEIEINIGGSSSFKGGTGPIILWCVCFLTIVFGLSILGAERTVTAEYKATEPRPVWSLMWGSFNKDGAVSANELE